MADDLFLLHLFVPPLHGVQFFNIRRPRMLRPLHSMAMNVSDAQFPFEYEMFGS
jgi:hypothetical protein